MLDPKRRQGFLRTLIDFQSSYNGIQKKHHLLNQHIHIHHHQGYQKCRSDKFPLLVSSGSRQNYSQGTDEGVLAFRAPNEVNHLLSHLVGGDGWLEKVCNVIENDARSDDDFASSGKNRKQKWYLVSAAEKVLARARDRSLGVVTQRSWMWSGNGGGQRKRKRGFHAGRDVRVSVLGMQGPNKEVNDSSVEDSDNDDSEEERSDNVASSMKVSTSLVHWLSEPWYKSSQLGEGSINEEALRNDENKAKVTSAERVADVIKDVNLEERKCEPDKSPAREEIQVGNEDDKDDVEDGYIAL